MTQGGGRGLPKCHVPFFQKKLTPFLHFGLFIFSGFMDIIFGKIKMSHHMGGGGTDECHKMTQEEGGSKKCHIFSKFPINSKAIIQERIG
jgi:hypothetical protein